MILKPFYLERQKFYNVTYEIVKRGIHFYLLFKNFLLEFPCGTEGQRPGVVTAVAQVTPIVQVGSLHQELPQAVGKAKNKNKKICVL